MSLSITVMIYPGTTLERMEATARALEDPQGIHEAMAASVELVVGDHIRGLNSRSPNTDFYAAAARGIEAESNATEALVRIPKLGFGLRYYGGRVEPGAGISSFTGKPTRALAVPTDDVPVVGPADGRHRQRPGQAGLLAFIPNRYGSLITTGYLVEGQEKPITRGKNKGKTRTVPKPGGRLLYTLRAWTTHDPDESVLPSAGVLFGAASDALSDYLDSFADDEGGAR